MKSYCVKEKRQTDCIPNSERHVRAKNGRLMLKCVCSSCGITKTKFVSAPKKLDIPSQDGGLLGDVLLEAGLKSIYQLGKMGVRNALRSTLAKNTAKAYVNKMTSKMIDQSLDNLASNIHTMDGSGLAGRNFLLSKDKRRTDIDDLLDIYEQQRKRGGNLDIHSLIGKLPKPKSVWTLPGHHYTGPYNPLDKQLKYDPNTGEILQYYQLPKNQVDTIASKHDVCYDMGKNKGDCDKTMLNQLSDMKAKTWRESLDKKLVQAAIESKYKLGLGVSKNVRSRRVKKKTGKKN